MLYVVVSEQLHVKSTRCDHCSACNQRTLLPGQLEIITVVLQRNNELNII